MENKQQQHETPIPQGKDYPYASNNIGHKLCYVCGCSSVFKELRIRANTENMNEPYFPFLQCHSAPKGVSQATASQLYVMACVLCYHSLHAQWVAYSRENKPHIQRIYHLKRNDGKSYIGADIHTQGEYASQILGLNTDNLPQNGTNLNILESKIDVHSSSLAHISEELRAIREPNVLEENLKNRQRNDDTDNTESIHHHHVTTEHDEQYHPAEHALNLCNAAGTVATELTTNGTFTQAEVGILDLSMPDKNSTTEVCYVCGEEHRRGSLKELKTVKTKDTKDGNSPYFPIFNEQHPRPARSRPKDPHGQIQACNQCYEFLLDQWNSHQVAKTPENERSYALRLKSPTTVTVDHATNTFCYACDKDLPKDDLCPISCYGSLEQKQIYSLLSTMKPFPNSKPAKGIIPICSCCYKKYAFSVVGERQFSPIANVSISTHPISKPVEAWKYSASDYTKSSINDSEHIRFKPYEVEKKSNANDNQPSLNSQLATTSTQTQNGGVEYSCYICKTLCTAKDLEWLYTSAEHMNSHAMHFPCLNRSVCDSESEQARMNESVMVNLTTDANNNRVLACKRCVSHLAHQWEKMDADRVPLEHRRYTIPYIPSSVCNDNKSNVGIRPSSAQSSQSSTSIYCFLCGLHSDLILARILYASKEGSRPFFPHLLTHKSPTNAEQLRSDYSALVCTFCYHSLMKQWHKYEEQTPNKNPMDRKYNWHDYICHLCSITTYRKRVRALPVNEFPFVKNRKNNDGLLLENGEYAAVCLDCYESLRQQSFQHDRFGVPISKRAYNWVPQPPPPEDSPDVTVARLPCGGRADSKSHTTGATRQNLKRFNKETTSAAKLPQKRPTLSPKSGHPSTLTNSGNNTDDIITTHYQTTSSSSQTFFTSALRNLAKQADFVESNVIMDQLLSNNGDLQRLPTDNATNTRTEKKTAKFDGVPKLSTGFQPYKTNERLQHLPAIPPSPLNSYAPFLNNFNANKFVGTPNFPYYPENLYCNVPRVANSLYAPIMPSYISHIYGLIPPPALTFPLDPVAYHHHSNAVPDPPHQAQRMARDEKCSVDGNETNYKKCHTWKENAQQKHLDGYGLYDSSSDQHKHLPISSYHTFENREQKQMLKSDISLSYQMQPKPADSNQLPTHQSTTTLSSSGLNTPFSLVNAGIQPPTHPLHYHQRTPYALYPPSPGSYNYVDAQKASLLQQASSPAPSPSMLNSFRTFNTEHSKTRAINNDNEKSTATVTSLNVSKELSASIVAKSTAASSSSVIDTPTNLADTKITEKITSAYQDECTPVDQNAGYPLNQFKAMEPAITNTTKESDKDESHADIKILDKTQSQNCD